MELTQGIKERRSIRRFSDQEVRQETLHQIIDLTRWAPSWKNSQTHSYIAVVDPDLKKQLAEEGTSFPNNKLIMGQAPVIMVQLIKDHVAGYNEDGSPSTSQEDHFQSYDAGLSGQTFSLAAHALGLGSVIMGLYVEADVKRILNISDDYRVAALIALGYPAQAASGPSRKPVEEILTIR